MKPVRQESSATDTKAAATRIPSVAFLLSRGMQCQAIPPNILRYTSGRIDRQLRRRGLRWRSGTAQAAKDTAARMHTETSGLAVPVGAIDDLDGAGVEVRSKFTDLLQLGTSGVRSRRINTGL